jgi:hypothetical protein
MSTTVKHVMKEKQESDLIAHLRKAAAKADNDNRRLRIKLGERQEFLESLQAAVAAATPQPPVSYNHIRASKTNTPIVPCLNISDLHIGERILAKETEGFGRFNWHIAQERLHNIVRNFLRWIEINREYYRINECHINCLGDYISGDIHDELKVTNEFPVPVQTAKAGLLLGDIFVQLSARFKVLVINEVGADNHGRLQKKPQAKQKTSNNMSYLVHTIANERASRCRNIHFNIAEGAKILVNINTKKFLMEHGDNIRGWAGFPYYGMGRMRGKEAQRRMNTRRGFDYWLMAHFHAPAIIESVILVNGSLSGTSEFDHGQGRYAGPAQVAFMVNPKHGMFNWTPFTEK